MKILQLSSSSNDCEGQACVTRVTTEIYDICITDKRVLPPDCIMLLYYKSTCICDSDAQYTSALLSEDYWYVISGPGISLCFTIFYVFVSCYSVPSRSLCLRAIFVAMQNLSPACSHTVSSTGG